MIDMNRRDRLNNDVLKSKDSNILLELPTGTGKTKIALDVINKRIKSNSKVLIVVPKLVLINTWKDEFTKWKYKKYLPQITFVTYVSFPKMVGKWDIVVYDECHHLSERCRSFLPSFSIKTNILLSATVGRNLKKEIQYAFKNLKIFRISAKEAIKDDILPDPTVYLIPLHLNNRDKSCEIIKNKGKGKPVTIEYKDRWKYKSYKGELHITCTSVEYYNDMSNLIEWYRKKINMPAMKNIFLHKAGERLKWLSNQKTDFVSHLLKFLEKERTLTFCSSILQTEALGKYCINSSNVQSKEHLNMFNDGNINHITACNMLDEGVNLVNCRIGIYANLNSSERIIIQRLGRLLRHPSPIIIIPYYKFTRDEEIVNKMKENYNPELIKTITNINDIIL